MPATSRYSAENQCQSLPEVSKTPSLTINILFPPDPSPKFFTAFAFRVNAIGFEAPVSRIARETVSRDDAGVSVLCFYGLGLEPGGELDRGNGARRSRVLGE